MEKKKKSKRALSYKIIVQRNTLARVRKGAKLALTVVVDRNCPVLQDVSANPGLLWLFWGFTTHLLDNLTLVDIQQGFLRCQWDGEVGWRREEDRLSYMGILNDSG